MKEFEELTKKPTSDYRASMTGYHISYEIAKTETLEKLTPGQANALLEDFGQLDAVMTFVRETSEIVITFYTPSEPKFVGEHDELFK